MTLQISRERLLFIAVMAVLVLVLSIINLVFEVNNHQLQQRLVERQSFINDSVKLSRLNEGLIQNIANIAAVTGDEQLKQLLADHGIGFTIKPTTPVAETEATP